MAEGVWAAVGRRAHLRAAPYVHVCTSSPPPAPRANLYYYPMPTLERHAFLLPVLHVAQYGSSVAIGERPAPCAARLTTLARPTPTQAKHPFLSRPPKSAGEDAEMTCR